MDELLRRWQRGWGLCRGLSPAEDRSTALEVTLGLPERDRELFAFPSSEFGALITETVQATRPTWLTITTHEPDVVDERLRYAGLTVFAERKLLMTCDLTNHPRPALPAQYELESATDGAVYRVKLLDRQGAIAARGMMAVVGGDAVMHDIHTDPAHRRRGLASVVMGELARMAVERRAISGILMATIDGGYLYAKLGWSSEATMLTATTPSRAA
ncbi:acetyltransferase (GNAT) family protein [Kribbella sp. VKM Ac-2527]|uniref:Acetyltransferase (GNAT) family protein n=1 Tax=Kribbella caucasensis TaxID=2512215 RepID=A0A4R6KLA1_9ACTN|nr:GNAT family N-acetyltransferase [Kribbella sp. VKM Ac-2527]TDO50566.1 acetyltransferase (GNAT) family protein [Kribbella sp. VKM Ac-2527]